MFSAKDDYERCVWLKKIQDSCSMHCGTVSRLNLLDSMYLIRMDIT